jgi:hypothetical protein
VRIIKKFGDFAVNEKSNMWMPMSAASARAAADFFVRAHKMNLGGADPDKLREEMALKIMRQYASDRGYSEKFPWFDDKVEQFEKRLIGKGAGEDEARLEALEMAMGVAYDESDDEPEKKENRFEDAMLAGAKLPAKTLALPGLREYKRSLFAATEINRKLRNGEELDAHEWAIAGAVGSAVDSSALPHDITVFRIIDADDFPFDIKKGASFVEKGILAASYDIDYLHENHENFEEPAILAILAKKGTGYYKFPDDFESEIVFDCGHKITFTGGEDEYKGVPVFDCEMD